MQASRTLYFSVVVALAGFLFGFDTVVISGADKALQELWNSTDLFHGVVVMSTALWGTVIGALFGSVPTNRLGRKVTLIGIGLLFLISAVGSAAANSPWVFALFRFTGGLGIGISTIAAPAYVSEIAPAGQRGKLVALYQFNIVFGILIAFISNYLLRNSGESAWRFMLGVEALPAFVYVVLVSRVPESPRWLLDYRNNEGAARRTLLSLLPESEAENELKSMRNEKKEELNGERIYQPKYRRALLLAFFIALFNQLSGINAFLYYAPRIFELAGMAKSTALLSTIGVGIINLICTLIGISMIDRFGRRTLMLIGSVGYIVSLGLVTVAFKYILISKRHTLKCYIYRVKRNLFKILLILFTLLTGYIMGYLRLPINGISGQFSLGLVIGISISIGIGIIYWTDYSSRNLDHQKGASNILIKLSGITKKLVSPKFCFMAIVFFLTGIVTLNIYRLHNELVKIHKKDEQRLIEISEATRNSNRMLIVDKVVEKMAREIDASELNTVSDATINRIAAISNLLRPYELLTNDNNGSVKLSPERGQLLLSILLLNPDSNTFKRIKKSVNFQWSDLRGIQLHDADLSGMNLCHSDLSNSSFTNSSFTNSNLSFSKLEQVEISNCDLSHCTIRQSNLQNAILSNSTIFQTNFSGSNMRFIQMNDSKVLESYFQWADLTGCFAVKADLSGSDFARSEMSGADLRFSNLENGRLAKTVLNGADLSGVNLENVNVQENWFYKMKKVQLIGIDSIMRSYRVDTTESKGGSKYFYLRKL